MRHVLSGISVCLILTLCGIVRANTAWTDWTAASNGLPGSAAGTIAAPSGLVSVSYSGEVFFAQVSGGTNFWLPNGPFLSGVVANEPPAADIVTLTGGNAIVNTLTFSPAVQNPVMAIMSLSTAGRTVEYDFDQPFDVISFGPGYFGGPGTLTELTGDVLSGEEGHGVIQFQGLISSVSWTVATAETWHGFTVGVVPEPASFCLVGIAAIGLLARRIRY
jgi:hypothetical protein